MSDAAPNAPLGPTWFFTQRLRDAGTDLLTRQADLLRDVVRSVRAELPFEIEAAIILPDQTHMIWTLPEGDADATGALRWYKIKSAFARHAETGDKTIWDGEATVMPLETAKDIKTFTTLIHIAPVQAGLCRKPKDWPHSSIHRDIAQVAPRPARPAPIAKAS